MDFELSEDQIGLRTLTRSILAGRVTPELLLAIDGVDGRFDAATWSALADADLIGISLPEDLGGSGYGLVEQCIVLEEIGRALAPVPVWASCVLGASTVATFGNDEQRAEWVPRTISGEVTLTAALEEPASRAGEMPGTRAERTGDGWRLTGVKTRVPAGTRATAVVVPAVADGSILLFLVDMAAAGVSVAAQRTTTGDATARIELDGVAVGAADLIGTTDNGAAILDWLILRAKTTLGAMQLGVCSRALELTVDYTKTREQFKRPIATFQAVGHRAADCFIDLQAMTLTHWQAVDRVEAGVGATSAVETAKFWAAEAGQRIVHAAVHLHGGVGTDRSAPMHRYFLAAKEIAFTLGSATEHLLEIGNELASAGGDSGVGSARSQRG